MALPNHHLLDPNATAIPFRLLEPLPSSGDGGLFAGIDGLGKSRANLSTAVRAYLAGVGMPDPDGDETVGNAVWYHALAIGFSPAYLTENRDGVQRDWPRVPLPAQRHDLERSAKLGTRLADLVDSEVSVDGIDTPPFDPTVACFGIIRGVGGGGLAAKDLAVEAGWGHGSEDRPVMPGRGKVVARDTYEPHVEATLRAALYDAGLPTDQLLKRLGPPVDVFLNETAYWGDVPKAVWEYRIGGYQVIKKWLSYRERSILGRALTMDEVEYVTTMIRRLAAVILMEPDLDANYATARDNGIKIG